MTGNRNDIFWEMDETVSQILAQMVNDFTSSGQHVYGYRIVIQNGEEPMIPIESANRCRTSPYPVAEVHTIGNEVKVIIELPGADIDNIQPDIKGSILTIKAINGEINYQTCIDIPTVDAESMQKSFKNGVLELTFQIKKGK